MADALTTISNFVTSPPARLTAGVAMAGIVWKFFEKVESLLTDETKLRIAVWLLDRKTEKTFAPWPDTFVRIFERVFGRDQFSWNCFFRSSVVSVIGLVITSVVITPGHSLNVLKGFVIDLFGGTTGIMVQQWRYLPVACLFGLFLPGYLSLLETRFMLLLLRRFPGTILSVLILFIDAVVTVTTAAVCAKTGTDYASAFFRDSWSGDLIDLLTLPGIALDALRMLKSLLIYVLPLSGSIKFETQLFYPTCISSIWLWLYAFAGSLLIGARRLDLGFDWFNRHFDIEHKPLSAIGVVAGAMVAVLWWGVVFVKWLA